MAKKLYPALFAWLVQIFLTNNKKHVNIKLIGIIQSVVEGLSMLYPFVVLSSILPIHSARTFAMFAMCFFSMMA